MIAVAVYTLAWSGKGTADVDEAIGSEGRRSKKDCRRYKVKLCKLNMAEEDKSGNKARQISGFD